jgi:DUF4097 and DUF4098 domain-containing protein YvlB
MKTSTQIWKRAAATLLATLVASIGATSLGLAGPADSGDELREEFHQTYPLSATGRVSVRNVSGAVHITGWDRNEVRVDVVKRATKRERLAEAEIKVESTGDSIRIWTKYPDHNLRLGRDENDRSDSGASVDYTISVPRGARLDSVDLVSGTLDITGITGDVRASCVSGHLKASGLSGEAKLSTVSGSLEAVFDRVSDSKPITLSTVNGSVVTTFPSDMQAQVRANTVNGPITNDFGLEVRHGPYVGNELNGQLGKGGATIRLNSVNGHLTIQHAADGKAVSPVTSLLPPQTDRAVARVRMGRQSSAEVVKARQNVAQARAQLQRAQREANNDGQRQATRALTQAERDVAQARADLQRVQSGANSDAQKAASQAMTEAERKLAEAQAALRQLQSENTSEQREKSQAVGEAERELAAAQAELQRSERDEDREAQRERESELRVARAEFARVQREMQVTIRREVRTEARSETRAAAREAVRASGTGLRFNSTESKSFTVSGKPRVTIGTFDGRITIHAWDKNEVMYTASKRTFDENALKGIALRAEQKGSEVSIIATLDEAYVHRLAGVKSVNAFTGIEVYVPRETSIHASTGEGGMTVEGVSGEIDLRNTSGSIVANNCKGRLTVNGGSGRVEVGRFDGELDARAGNGGLHLDGRFRQLTAQTNNEPIVLSLSPDTNAVIETNAASVMNELQATEESGQSQRVKRFKIGSGGPLFTLHAGESRIYLRPAGSGPM